MAAALPLAMPSTAQIRVRYKDADTMSVVYYGNYLTYFEVGRVEYLRQRGWPMSEVNRRIHLPVVEAFVKYVKPARLDDLLEISSWVSERKRASFKFSYAIRDEAGEVIATGFTLHACWDPATSRMIAIPECRRRTRSIRTPTMPRKRYAPHAGAGVRRGTTGRVSILGNVAGVSISPDETSSSPS